MALKEVFVPDIGNYKEVDVIELLVKVGDTITKEQSLLTLETDKATMEIPSSEAGIIKELLVKPGSKISQGSLVLRLEVAGEAAAAPVVATPAPAKAVEATPTPTPPAVKIDTPQKDAYVHAGPAVRQLPDLKHLKPRSG